ncbi:MAG: NAD(P)/FAD-dependent oxidoreductase, partial [Alphaproteobacteria bacterium]|nr:NAD(P)/FAD-dependent oxidoreductase [Alphaproteobacteria bacterium]
KDGKSYPGVAPVAKQQGKFVAQHIVSRIKSKSIKPFRYKDFGSMATIGRYSAIADFNGLHIKGWLGWFLWGWIHIFFLIGFRNRLRVYASWTYEYFTFKRGSRLILSEAEDE